MLGFNSTVGSEKLKNAIQFRMSVLGLIFAFAPFQSFDVSANESLDCSTAYPSKSTFWPPNHKFQPISISGVNGAPAINVLCVRQVEPLNSTGDGNTEYDGFGVGGQSASVRSERKGNGNGRVYHIAFSATDSEGAS